MIEVAFLNGQPSFLFACHGAGYSVGLSTVTGEVVLSVSLAGRRFNVDALAGVFHTPYIL
jgi:hypothetical protein